MAEQPGRAVEHGENIALTVAFQWSIAVRAQAERIRTGSGVGRFSDAYLLVLAVRNVRRAAEMASQHARTGDARDRIAEAIDNLDNELPGARAVRDVLEHFDEYSQGRGHLQQPGVKRGKRQPDEDLASQYVINVEGAESDPTALTIRVGDHSVDLAKSPRAAADLVHAVRAALAAEQGGVAGAEAKPAVGE